MERMNLLPDEEATQRRGASPSKTVAQVALGLLIGYLLGSLFQFDEIDARFEQTSHVTGRSHAKPDESGAAAPKLRCAVVIRSAITDKAMIVDSVEATYGARCDELLFISDSERLQKTFNDNPRVFAVRTPDLGSQVVSLRKWSFVRPLLRFLSSNKTSDAEWTLLADERTFFAADNARALLHGLSGADPIVIGLLRHAWPWPWRLLFPWTEGEMRVSLEAGVLLTRSALERIVTEDGCRSFFHPRAANEALGRCAKLAKVQLLQPVDENNLPVFHDQCLRRAIERAGQIPKPVDTSLSEHAVSFGNCEQREVRMLAYVTYAVRPFGHQNFVVEPNGNGPRH